MNVATKNANLNTMTVTIKALHVNDKQMTLAVFRQLPITSAFDNFGKLRDMEFWGLVRYALKDGPELWAVASLDGILYRCDANPSRNSIKFHKQSIEIALSDLQAYMVWEEKIIKWREWQSLADDEKHGRTAPEWVTDSYRFYDGTFLAIGQQELFKTKIMRTENALATAIELEQSIIKLAKLPQLFIAV